MKDSNVVNMRVNTKAKSTVGGGPGDGNMEDRIKRIESSIGEMQATIGQMNVTLARLDERTKDAPTKAWFYSTIVPIYFALFAATAGALKWLLTPEIIVAIINRLANA